MSREALFVGVDRYDHRPDLKSCAGDARAIAELLAQNDPTSPVGVPNWTPAPKAVLTTDHGKRVLAGTLELEIDKAVRQARNGDFLFYFAGHGRRTESGLVLASQEDNPDDEPSGVLVPALLDKLARARLASATLILDCCFAGMATASAIGSDTCVLASTGADDQARELDLSSHSVFTDLLLLGLRGQAADTIGRITSVSLFTYIAGTMDLRTDGQSPEYAGRISRLPVLRWAPGTVSLPDLTRLTQPSVVKFRQHWVAGEQPMFPSATAAFSVEPDHEAPDGGNRPSNLAPHQLNLKQQEMDYLKRLRDAGLLAAYVNGEKTDLFFAVKEHGEVRLTSQGQFFWKAVHDARLKFS